MTTSSLFPPPQPRRSVIRFCNRFISRLRRERNRPRLNYSRRLSAPSGTNPHAAFIVHGQPWPHPQPLQHTAHACGPLAPSCTSRRRTLAPQGRLAQPLHGVWQLAPRLCTQLQPQGARSCDAHHHTPAHSRTLLLCQLSIALPSPVGRLTCLASPSPSR